MIIRGDRERLSVTQHTRDTAWMIDVVGHDGFEKGGN